MWSFFKLKDPKLMIPVHLLWCAVPVLLADHAVSFGFFMLGMVYANWMEYYNHIFHFHLLPQLVTGQKDSRFYYVMHGHHHKHPRKNPITPLPQTLALYVGSAAVFRFFSPARHLDVLAGGAVGFLIFELTHIFIHAAERDDAALNWFKPLIEFHLTHHADPTVAYGFTSPFWDWLFGKLPPKRKYNYPIVPIPLPWVSFFLSKLVLEWSH
jgi:sterol desaturase/sphingolipid hydroxylase (fatty acid hydroxylase superfamily)